MCNDKELDESDIKYYFTSKDIVDITEFLEHTNNYTLEGLVQYFNSKYDCNRIVEVLKDIIDNGIKMWPKVAFRPVTEKCELINGEFTLSNKPYNMDGFFFLNNLVVVKDQDGKYEFFDDVNFDSNTMICSLNQNISGYATVSYYVLQYDNIK